MTDFMHDPDSLADLLDSLLPDGNAVPGSLPATDDPLIEAATRLAKAPRPELDAAAMARISAKINAAQSLPKAASTSGPILPLLPIALFVVIIGGIIAFVVLPGGSTEQPENTPVPTLTETLVPMTTQTATATVTVTATIQPTSTALSSATITILPSTTSVPTATNTVLPSATAVPTLTVESAAIPEITAEITPDLVEVPITVIVEGPVEAITANIIVIFDIEITLAPDNPLLSVIQLGDILRVEGELIGGERLTMLLPVTVVVVDVEVYVNPDDGQVWRDNGNNCNNPPPPWAPANGWRARCEGGSQPGQGNSGRGNNNGGGQGQGQGQGGGQGMGDDDD